MQLYNLIQYRNNYSETSVILWRYCRDEPTTNPADGKIAGFTGDSVTDSFKIKGKIPCKITFVQ